MNTEDDAMSAHTLTAAFKPGDVLRYRATETKPTGLGRPHCREELAVVNNNGKAVDTYWGFGGDHVLTPGELESAEHLGNLTEFVLHEQHKRRQPDAHGRWEDYGEAVEFRQRDLADARQELAELEAIQRAADV